MEIDCSVLFDRMLNNNYCLLFWPRQAELTEKYFSLQGKLLLNI